MDLCQITLFVLYTLIYATTPKVCFIAHFCNFIFENFKAIIDSKDLAFFNYHQRKQILYSSISLSSCFIRYTLCYCHANDVLQTSRYKQIWVSIPGQDKHLANVFIFLYAFSRIFQTQWRVDTVL